MTDANRVQIAIEEETIFASPPGGNLQVIRYTGETMTHDTDTTVSQEIRADRETADIVRTDVSVSGDISVELSYDGTSLALDKLMQNALVSAAWSGDAAVISGNVGIDADASTQQFKGSAATFDFFEVADWIYVENFSTAANNGYFKITAIAGDGSTIDVVGAAALILEAAGNSIDMTVPSHIVAGTTLKSLVMEKAYTDSTPDAFMILTGVSTESMNITIGADTISTGSFSYTGKIGAMGAVTVGSGYVAQTTGRVLNGIDDVDFIVAGIGSSLTEAARMDATAVTLDLANNLRTRKVIGELGAQSIGAGQINISGTVQAFFATKDKLDAYMAFTESAFGFVTGDDDGRYIFDLPRMKFTSGSANASGINTDVLEDLAFTGYLRPGIDASFKIYRHKVNP